MIIDEFKPILFFLLWGILSWVMKKKKKQLKEKTQEEPKEIKLKADPFARIQQLQNPLSKVVDIFTTASNSVEIEEEYFSKNDEHGFEEVETPIAEVGDLHRNERYVFETDIKSPTTEKGNWLKQALSDKSELKKLMVLRKILGEPRSLKPYTGDYFQS